jgi:uncharacterized membrane protein
MNEDLQYLKLLSIFHYIVGGFAAVFSFIPVIYVVIGILAVCIPGSFEGEGEAMPLFIGWIFIIIGAVLIVVGWTFSACIIIAGRSLGVFTIIVLARPSVKEMFELNTVPKSPAA